MVTGMLGQLRGVWICVEAMKWSIGFRLELELFCDSGIKVQGLAMTVYMNNGVSGDHLLSCK